MPVQAAAATGSTASSDKGFIDRTYAKVFWRLVPFLMLCYIVAYLDRVNVGFAKLQMSKELGFSETAYGLGAGIFFLGYFLFEVPSNIILHRVGARVWIARIMITWGLISGAFVFVNSEASFYAMRFLLGLAEAGFYPGVILYVTSWFPSHRRARVITVFMAAIPVSGVFGNPLSGWIMDTFHETHGLSGWQWMFLLEAIPAVLVGIAGAALPRQPPLRGEVAEPRRAAGAGARHRRGGAHQDRQPALPRHRVPQRPRVVHEPDLLPVRGRQYGLAFWVPTIVKASASRATSTSAS